MNTPDKKKMQLLQFSDFVRKFKPAILRKNAARWYVEYYVLHPIDLKMVRKIIKINAIKPVQERRKYGTYLVDEINQKLYSGWNPFFEDHNNLLFTPLNAAIDKFKANKYGQYSRASIVAYNSVINIFVSWLNTSGYTSLTTGTINNMVSTGYMDYLLMNRKLSERAYNNHAAFLKSIFNWFKIRGYCLINPFDVIENLKVKPKHRKPLTPAQKLKLKTYLLAEDPNFYLVCLLLYSCKIRLTEMTKLRIKNVDLVNSIITVPGYDDKGVNISKNKKTRSVMIPDSVKHYFDEMEYNCQDPNFYLVGKGFKPGPVKISNASRIGEYFRKIADQLGFDNTITFYSLKDTGIMDDIINGLPLLSVRDQAGHHSIEETNKYMPIVPETLNQIKLHSKDM